MGNTSSSERSSDSGSDHGSIVEGPSETPTDSVCTDTGLSPKSILLRYTPPPSELHLHLINDVDPPAEFSSRKMQGGVVPESADVETANGTSPSTRDKAPSTPSKESGETLKAVDTSAAPKNGVKLILKIPSSGKRTSRVGDVNIPKVEDEPCQGADTPASASLRTSYYYPGRNAEESEQRFQRLLQHISDELLSYHTLDDALESIVKEPPGKSKVAKEDVALARIHRIYCEFDELDWEIRLLNAGLMIGTNNHFSKEFAKVLGDDGPITLEKTLQLDMALNKIRGSGGPYRSVFTDWVESLISTILNLKLSEMWNAHTTRDRRRFTEAAFDEINRLEQNNEWDSEEKAQEFKTWSKQQERMTVVRNQIWKLYKMFGATVLLEVNTFRPIFDGQPISRSVPFPPLVRHITTRFREAIGEGDQLLIFQAKFWEDDLEWVNVVDGEELWAEWVTRSHKSACRVIVPVVKAVAGEQAATWVSTFLSEVPPDVFIGNSDSDTS